MKIFRNDPIVSLMKLYKNEIESLNLSEKELEIKSLELFRKNEIIKALGCCYYAQEKYIDNSIFRLRYYDALIRLGFFFDAQNYIEELFFSKNIKTVLIIERLIDLYHSQSDFLKIVDMCQNNLNLIFKSEKSLRNYMSILKKIRRFDLYNFLVTNFYDKLIKLLNEEISLLDFNGFNCELVNLYEAALNNTKDNLENIIDKIWFLYHKGERSILFFRLATRKYDTESPTGLRQIFFLNQARKFHSESLEFLYEYYQNMCFRKFYEHVYFDLMSINLIKIITNPILNLSYRKNLYYFYIKLCCLVKDKDHCLLSYDEALFFDLLKPFTLELTRQTSIQISSGKGISIEISDIFNKLPVSYKEQANTIFSSLTNIDTVEEESIDLLLVGQMRGGEYAINDLEVIIDEYNLKNISFSTWDTQPLFPPRFNSIRRSLGNNIFRKIPLNYSNAHIFKNIFINFTNKIESFSNQKFSTESFSNIKKVINFSVVSENNFDSKFNDDKFLVADKLHQAKMFFHFSNIRNLMSNSNVIIRKRPDVKPYFNFKLNDYFDCLLKEKNFSYITYFDHNLGFGDRFILGNYDAITKMSKIWDLAVESKKLIYADFFDDFTHIRAAEHLISSHAVATGVKIRYLHCHREDFLQADNVKYVPLKNEFISDFEKLDSGRKEELSDFYNYMLNILI